MSAEKDAGIWCSEHMEPYCPRHTVENGLPTCGSCGEPAPYTITLRGEPMPACLRHLNVWRTPNPGGKP